MKAKGTELGIARWQWRKTPGAGEWAAGREGVRAASVCIGVCVCTRAHACVCVRVRVWLAGWGRENLILPQEGCNLAASPPRGKGGGKPLCLIGG